MLILASKGTNTIKVDRSVTAKTVGSGSLDVLATPVMIASMENAAQTSVASQLEPGYGTVGVLMNVRHLAPTPIGGCVTAESELIEIDGRRLVFRVTASDGHEIVGDGVHERVVIDEAKFLEKAQRKAEERGRA
ncbi:MAG: thioesterase family protein [Evtepia sp.]